MQIKECTHAGQNSLESYVFKCVAKFKNSYESSFGFCNSPFGNCQNFSVIYFNNILKYAADDEVIEVVKYMKERTGKRLMLLDVHTKHSERIEKIFSDRIKFKQDYVNTYSDGNKMTLYSIDTENL